MWRNGSYRFTSFADFYLLKANISMHHACGSIVIRAEYRVPHWYIVPCNRTFRLATFICEKQRAAYKHFISEQQRSYHFTLNESFCWRNWVVFRSLCIMAFVTMSSKALTLKSADKFYVFSINFPLFIQINLSVKIARADDQDDV